MNKKGFLKILESIIAIVIVLGFVIAILPTKPQNNAKIPPDLDQTTDTILKEIQNVPNFRQCVILNNATCIQDFITSISLPSKPWVYAVRLCKINFTLSVMDCAYNPPVSGTDLTTKNTNFVNSLPKDKDIYNKETTITVPDVSGIDLTNSVGNYTRLNIYAWSKN